MIDKLIETKKESAYKWKMQIEFYQKVMDETNKYEQNEFLNASCSMNFAKGMYMALTREIKSLEELKKSQLNYTGGVCQDCIHRDVLEEKMVGVDIDE